jgi:hypothetical protein
MSQGVTPWDAYASYIKQLRPDVVLFPGSTEDAILALRAMAAVGIAPPLVGGDATSGLEANAAEFPMRATPRSSWRVARPLLKRRHSLLRIGRHTGKIPISARLSRTMRQC